MKNSQCAILGTCLIALAAGAPHAYVFNVVSDMSHNPAGSQYNANTWTMTASQSTTPAMVYGPYATYIPGGLNFVYTKVEMIPSGSNWLSLFWDVVDQYTGQTLGARGPLTNVPKTVYLAAFADMPSVSNLEVRTYHLGNGTLRQNNIHVLTVRDNMAGEFWPTEAPYNNHIVGAQVPGTKLYEANPASGTGYLTYGPYVNLYKGTGSYVAAFSLSIDTPFPATERVAAIDVVFRNPGGSTVYLTRRDIYRGDFDQSGVMTAFPLEFTNDASGNWGWEFRVRYAGKGTLRQGRTNVYKVF